MRYFSTAYRLAIAFWVGGAALFTSILTPIIFRSYDRDMAGNIVGILLPGYLLVGIHLWCYRFAMPVAGSRTADRCFFDYLGGHVGHHGTPYFCNRSQGCRSQKGNSFFCYHTA